MMLKWFNANEAASAGVALADQFAQATASADTTSRAQGAKEKSTAAILDLLRHVDREVRCRGLNFYQKAKFANSLKWRLIEKGIEAQVADEVTHAVIMHLSNNMPGSEPPQDPAATVDKPDPGKLQNLLRQAVKSLDAGAYAQAVIQYQEFLVFQPRHAEALCNLGVAFFKLGRYQESEQCYREAIEIDPLSAEALCNLATLLQGNPADAEEYLRRALKINPKYADARSKLGMALAFANRLHEAKGSFKKALKLAPSHTEAMLGLAQIARTEGHFDEAESLIKRALKIHPKLPGAWAALNGLKKMTVGDTEWLKTAEEIADSGISVWEEAEMRFAIGKYFDDLDDFEPAFKSFKRANELLKTVAGRYDRQAHASFADDLIRGHSREALSRIADGGSSSAKPVFVLGMPRSGTSLAEQIIASHPVARGAGELQFWLDAARANHDELRQGILAAPARTKLAEEYLRVLTRHGGDALRVVDKSNFNCDYLGLLHSALPNARVIYMRRDPIDTCLSCYFQLFSTGMKFTMDLQDLADYHKVHRRLMKHWRAALPADRILEVPYEELVADQEAWTRRILDFLELEWDERCLSFHQTERSVNTASAWQVRQKIYNRSVGRWRRYEKYIGPLKGLRE